MDERSRIERALREYFQRVYGVSEDSFEADFPLAAFVDSLGVLSLLEHIRDELGIGIDPQAISEASFGTFRKMVEFVARAGKAQT